MTALADRVDGRSDNRPFGASFDYAVYQDRADRVDLLSLHSALYHHGPGLESRFPDRRYMVSG